MTRASPIDRDWREAHRLPAFRSIGKAERGRVLLAGGSRRVPGGVLLTGEAALRTGAGKLRIATIEKACLGVGLAFPEAGIVALPENEAGEIGAAAAPILIEQIETCEALIFGPAMGGRSDVAELVRPVLSHPREGMGVVLDAAALVACADGMDDVVAGHGGRVVMTPHHGEMGSLMALAPEAVATDPARVAAEAARRFNAVVVLKDRETAIAAPSGEILLHTSECVGLGTAGSGDVLAGVIGELLARGIDPLEAAAWGVWLHGQAGAGVARRVAPAGFLARELLPEFPALIAAWSQE